MDIRVFETKEEMGQAAAADGAKAIREALAERDQANLIVATGASQFEMLAALAANDIDWSKTTFFHLDEYVGMPIAHPASFRRYLKERFIDKLPWPPHAFHFVDGEGESEAECARLSELVSQCTIDVAFIGIGENGHLAFNDPPADFETDRPFFVVELDDACRRQQWGEGWFDTLDDVPCKAITMSISQILKSRKIVCTVPDERKSEAVRGAVEGPVTPEVPASILQKHANATLFLDKGAASKLS
jgi:glucosamine-6-phosphate deaminase